MGRAKKSSIVAWDVELGRVLGAALGEGIAEGLRPALKQLREELDPLGYEVARSLSRATEPSAAAPLAEGEAPGEGLRRCAESGCGRRAIARGLCRRHYARQAYREKKQRASETGAEPSRESRAQEDAEAEAEKKVVAPVPPVIRRRKEGEAPEAPQAAKAPVLTVVSSAEQDGTVAANGAPAPGVPATPIAPPVVLDQVARFFGRK